MNEFSDSLGFLPGIDGILLGPWSQTLFPSLLTPALPSIAKGSYDPVDTQPTYPSVSHTPCKPVPCPPLHSYPPIVFTLKRVHLGKRPTQTLEIGLGPPGLEILESWDSRVWSEMKVKQASSRHGVTALTLQTCLKKGHGGD